MAWKPWYERMADMDSAEEREEFLKGVFGPAPMKGSQVANMALTTLLVGYGVRALKRRK